MRLGEWLAELGLERYAPLLEQHRIDIDVLPDLTDEDLERLGIPVGDRKRLLKASGSLRQSAPASPTERLASVERRQVAVLFLDIAGCTRLVSSLGAEAAHDLMQRFYKRIFGDDRIQRRNDRALHWRRSHGGVWLPYCAQQRRGSRGNHRACIHELMPQQGSKLGIRFGARGCRISVRRLIFTNRHRAQLWTVGNAANLGARIARLRQLAGR